MAMYGRTGSDDDEPLANAVCESRAQRLATPSQHAMISAGQFYRTYSGHNPRKVEQILDVLFEVHGLSATAIFLAGDSSLDNKTWLFNQGAPAEHWRPAAAHAPAVNGFEHVLDPPRMVCDVSYWMNRVLHDCGASAFTVNTAIEATTLASRVGGVQCCIVPTCGGLYEQDCIIRDRIRANDMLVISVGGNDIALAPSIFTVVALVLLMLTPWPLLGVWHPAVAYFVFMFRYQVQRYASLLTERTRLRKG